MHKLCSLKDIAPGSVIEVPREYRRKEGEVAVLLGLNYQDKKKIEADFIREVNDEFVTTSMPAQDADTQLALSDDRTISQAVMNAFVTHKLLLPELGMSMGCDPEVFVEHEDGSIFPAWEFMPSEEAALRAAKSWDTQEFDYSPPIEYYKTHPVVFQGKVWRSVDHNAEPRKIPAYWDGAQAEFAPWAKNCLETLHCGTQVGLKTVLEAARTKDPKARLTLRNVVELAPEVLKNTPNEFIQFRCSQSFNVYGDCGDGVPDARLYKYRCSGGHIHIGCTRKFTAVGIEQIVRGLDAVLGVIGVSLAAGIDNPERRHTYGRAGEFRLPAHGIEYRVLSNFWLSHPAIAMLVFELARASVRLAKSGLFNLSWAAKEEETREVINNCDVDGARKILTRNHGVIQGMLRSLWTQVSSEPWRAKMREQALQTIMKGIGEVIERPFDIEGNWKLHRGFRGHCHGENESWLELCRGLK